MSVLAASGKPRETRIVPGARRMDFSFLPKGLLERCTPIITRYHKMNGYSCLPDILWHPEIRNFIEIDTTFQCLFKKSTSSRSAKRANEGLVCIASIILAIEILSDGLAGWGNRYPHARKKAQALLQEFVPSSRAWLTERYLYSQIKRSEGFGPPDHDADARFNAQRNALHNSAPA
jgi:hypothetical protein